MTGPSPNNHNKVRAEAKVAQVLMGQGQVPGPWTGVNCPCPEQGRNLNNQLSSAISDSILPIEPQDHNQTIHRNPVNGLVMIFRFCS